MIRRFLIVSFALATALASGSTGSAGTPVEIRPDGVTGTRAAIASVGPARVVVVWTERDGTYGRFLAATGRPVSPIFRIGSINTTNQYVFPPEPDVAGLPGGGYVVSWRERPEGSSWRTLVQRFDGDGRPREDAVVVPMLPVWPSWNFKIAVGDGGDVVVAAYQSRAWRIQVHRVIYAPQISISSFDFPINSANSKIQLADVGVGPGNRPVVVWNRFESGWRGAHNEINAASFETDGTMIDGFSMENTSFMCSPRGLTAASNATGTLVVWSLFDCSDALNRIWGHRFGPSGHLINQGAVALTDESGSKPTVTLRGDGYPILGWSGSFGIQARGALGIEQPTIVADGAVPAYLRIAGDEEHGYVVLWELYGGASNRILAAPYALRATRDGGDRISR